LAVSRGDADIVATDYGAKASGRTDESAPPWAIEIQYIQPVAASFWRNDC
jgi:hypothetical protein